VSEATGYRLDVWRLDSWQGQRFFSHNHVQMNTGDHPASYSMGTGRGRRGRSFSRNKIVWDMKTLHLHLMPRSRMHLYIPPCLHGLVLKHRGNFN
jgi:hypothetical protein